MKKTVTLLIQLTLLVPLYALEKEDPFFHQYDSDEILIRWAFQNHCHFSFDQRTSPARWPSHKKGVTFNPKDVQSGDIIFVRNADIFFETIHPKINKPYIIVTHGEHLDEMKEEYFSNLDDPKIIAWFGIHPSKTSHAKFHAIPIGIVQKRDHFNERKRLNALFTDLRRNTEKKHLVYMNFAFNNAKEERLQVRELFKNKNFCKRGARTDFETYLKEMAECKFTLSPTGMGPDCYRTWEALYVGSIPVVKTSHLDPLFAGLPVLIIDDWKNVSEKYLQEKYREMTSRKYNMETLYMSHWLNQIDTVRNNFLTTYGTKE